MQIEISLVESINDCANTGFCCLGCPNYDSCDQHYEEDEG